jgi:mRNA interferase MazF
MKQSEIWLINLDPTIGAEIKKIRPAIIVNDNHLGKLPLKVVVPITDWKERYSIAVWMVKIIPDKQNKLSKLSSADCFQIRSVSEDRFIKKIGIISSTQLEKIQYAITRILSISNTFQK